MISENRLKKNDEIVIKIERLGSNGEGIGVYSGAVIFVPYALVGEECLVHIVSDKKTFYFAKLIKVLEPSKDRAIPPCPYFMKCGGCDIQHTTYSNQLKLKQEIVASDLKKYAEIENETNKTVPSEREIRYRNKFAFPVEVKGDGEVLIGMYRKHSHDILSINDCLLQSEKTAKIIKIFKNFMQNHVIFSKNCKNLNVIKHIVVRENQDKFILTIVVNDEKFNNFEPLINLLKNEFDNFGLYKNINKLNNNVILGDKDIHIYGLKELEVEEFGIKYNVNNRSFMQVNDEVKSKIYTKILELLSGELVVIDAYSGAGLLSSIIAKSGIRCYGIEIVKEATKNAEELKQLNNLNGLTNINGDCSVELPKLTGKIKEDFSLVIDPPRKGVDKKVIDTIVECKPKKVIYLSCNPATLARDLKPFLDYYKISLIQPYDMFPQTANVETLVCLERKANKKSKSTSSVKKNLNQKIKQKYFDFYDDIKDGTHKVVDW